MKKKSNQNTNHEPKKPISLTPLQTIQDLMGWKSARMNEAVIDNLCDYLIQWSQHDDAIYIGTGLKKFGMPREKFYDWCKRSEKLKEAHKIVKENVGENLFRLGMLRKLETTMVQRILPQFTREFRRAVNEEQAFKKELSMIKKDALKEAVHEIAVLQRGVDATKEVDDAQKDNRSE